MFRNLSIAIISLLFITVFSGQLAWAEDDKTNSSPAALSSDEAASPIETLPVATTDVSAADEHLRKLWQDNSSKYANITSEISELLGPNENLSKQLANVTNLMAEFNRFKLIFQTSAGHPSEQVEVLGNIKRLRQLLASELGPLETNLNNLNLKLDEAESTKDSIAEMVDSGDPNIVNYQRNIEQAISRLQAAQSSLTDTINPIKSAIDTLDKSIAEINLKIPTIWNSYYFGDTGLGGVFQIQKDLFSWFDSFALRAIFMFPQDRDSRVSSLFRFIVTLAIMALVASIIFTYQKKIPPDFADLFSVFFKGPWIIMSLGLALMAASMTQMGGSYLLLKLPGILLIIRALATVSWRLRIWTNPALKDNRSPLHRFYAPSALGVAFLFSDLPASAVTVVWLITMAFFLYYLNRFGKKADEKPKSLPELVAYGSGIYFALGSLLVTILGYSRLAILVFMCLFALANILILGSALVVLTVKICDYVFNPKIAPIKNALANSLAAPCSFLLSLFSALPWLLGVPGSTNLLDSMMNRGYNVGSASISFYRIFFIIMLLLLFRSMGALANTSLVHLNDKFNNLKSGFMQSIRTLMNYIIWCLFAVIALSLLGVNFTSIILAATGFSVGISMGLQSIVNNLFSGLILILGGNVQIDNLIEVDGVIGKVVGINIRCTVLEPADNSWVYVPNSSLVNGRFINWTRNNRLVRRKIDFRTVYGTDIDKAREIMIQAAMKAKYAAKVDPFLPSVSVTDLSENAVILTLAVTILDIDQNASTQSEIREGIYKGFNENGIGFYIGSSLDINLTEPSKAAQPESQAPENNHLALEPSPKSDNLDNGETLVIKSPTT
ncbi:MAG: mechanosensitive ion channel [Deltaproteobacteria bacterium]|jgi:small-conductance mechanosensitive channel|nr:mechanosensitive ion channel [Deltaproteobacteria bacterium]